jgi:Fic/DOC family N-terminal
MDRNIRESLTLNPAQVAPSSYKVSAKQCERTQFQSRSFKMQCNDPVFRLHREVANVSSVSRPQSSPRIGRFITTTVEAEAVRAYVPPPPPPMPPADLGGLMSLIEQSNRALGRLDGVTSILPSPPLFCFMYVRKEALLSSQIEGTQS